MKFTDTEKGWLLDTEGIERQHIYNWEQGGGISIKYLPAVAKVKRITIDELVRQLNEEEKNSKAVANG
jgi:transcriptional regulator with XRE-family HTH domain